MEANDQMERALFAECSTTVSGLTVGALGSATTTPYANSVNYLGNYWPYNTYAVSTPAKIRLKLSEVERLRLAAKEDKKLKEVLQKFAAHIEIEVDFE